MTTPNILIFSGSIRRASMNVRLAKHIASELVEFGATPNLISLRDFPMPIYDGDLEAENGPPAAAVRLARLMSDHDGVMIVSPEYNAGPTPLLLNTLDWVSRVRPTGDQPLNPFKGPVFALAGTSPGVIGTLRALTATRTLLETGFGTLVIPEQLAVPQSGQAFDADGNLTAERPRLIMKNMLTSLVHKAGALKEKP